MKPYLIWFLNKTTLMIIIIIIIRIFLPALLLNTWTEFRLFLEIFTETRVFFHYHQCNLVQCKNTLTLKSSFRTSESARGVFVRSCLLELFPFWFFEFFEASTLDEPNKKRTKICIWEELRNRIASKLRIGRFPRTVPDNAQWLSSGERKCLLIKSSGLALGQTNSWQ